MAARPWQVRLTDRAQADFDDIVDWTFDAFGPRQSRVYMEVIVDAVEALKDGPMLSGSFDRSDIGPGLRTLHVARAGRRGSHLLLYRAAGDRRIDLLRILHERMDPARHHNTDEEHDSS
jgi:toxin ParE1/3/4